MNFPMPWWCWIGRSNPLLDRMRITRLRPRSICLLCMGEPVLTTALKAHETSNDFQTAKHHQRTQRDVLICRSTGEFAPRASVAPVTLGH